MKRNRPAVFAASLQFADAVKVVSRGVLRSRTSVTWGIWWSVSAAQKDGESGVRFLRVRFEHLLAFIGRSHFPAQAQVEEREQSLVGIVGTPFFTSCGRRKADSLRVAGRLFEKTEFTTSRRHLSSKLQLNPAAHPSPSVNSTYHAKQLRFLKAIGPMTKAE